ncbi:hypothetical protein QBC39DRAFT_415125 [Podospora conica]|nr:hypothetical protein QBC39DRAFT_415125 [Schizothecium conicum]
MSANNNPESAAPRPADPPKPDPTKLPALRPLPTPTPTPYPMFSSNRISAANNIPPWPADVPKPDSIKLPTFDRWTLSSHEYINDSGKRYPRLLANLNLTDLEACKRDIETLCKAAQPLATYFGSVFTGNKAADSPSGRGAGYAAPNSPRLRLVAMSSNKMSANNNGEPVDSSQPKNAPATATAGAQPESHDELRHWMHAYFDQDGRRNYTQLTSQFHASCPESFRFALEVLIMLSRNRRGYGKITVDWHPKTLDNMPVKEEAPVGQDDDVD